MAQKNSPTFSSAEVKWMNCHEEHNPRSDWQWPRPEEWFTRENGPRKLEKSCRIEVILGFILYIRLTRPHPQTFEVSSSFPSSSLSTANTNLATTNDFWRVTKHLRGQPVMDSSCCWDGKLLSFVEENSFRCSCFWRGYWINWNGYKRLV